MKRTILLFVFLLLPATGLAQTEFMRAADGSSITAEVLIPNFKNEFGFTYTGMTILLAGNIVVSDMISVKVEVPYVQSKIEYSSPFSSGSSSKGSVGNPYIGVGIGPSTGMLSADFGVRPSTISEGNIEAIFSGIYGDMPNIERYLEEATSIHAGINFQPQLIDNLSLHVRFAPSLWIQKEGSDKMWLSHYGLGASYQVDMVRIGAGVNGLWKMSEEGFLFGQKDALHYFGAEINARFGMIRPGVTFRIPLDKELEIVKSTIGVSVGILF